MDDIDLTRNRIRRLLESQKLGVLATQERGHPYTCLMAFSYSQDLSRLLFATSEATRKFANLTANPGVSMLFDSRPFKNEDFKRVSALTAVGTAGLVGRNHAEDLVETYLARHPYLEEFIETPTTRLFEFRIRTYTLVRAFENVSELIITP